MPQASRGKNNTTTRDQTPWQTAAHTVKDFPWFTYVIKAARKTMQKTSPTVQYNRICFHSCRFQALAYIDIDSLGLQLSTKFHDRKKKPRKIKICDKIFWTCFWQDLELNFQSPSFSAVFPPFFAVFCPLKFLFFYVFPGLPLLFSWQQILLYSLPLSFGKMLQMLKIQQKNPVRQHFVGNDSLPDRFSHAEAMPLVLGDVTLLRFGIGFTKALRS